MERNLFAIILSLMLCHLAEGAQEVLVVESARIKPYDEALKGFMDVCGCTTKELVLSEMKAPDVLKEIRETMPDMVLAIGMDALSNVKGIKDIPVVYLMVPNPESIIAGKENITGVSMNIPPKKQLGLLQQVLPDVKRVGILYDPAKTGYFVKKAQYVSRELGIELIAKEVRNSKDVPSILNGMKERIDAFWMAPDTTVVTPETIEFLLLFSLENKIPVITFSEKYVEMGALMSVSIDAFDAGRQAGEIAGKILSGADIRNLPGADAEKAVLSINLKIAKKLGITINNGIIRKVRIIN